MAYSNLKAEMARVEIKQRHIADVLGISVKSVSDRLRGKQKFKVHEAIKIRDSYFTDKTIDYLFSDKEEN